MPQVRCPNCGMTINLENRREIDFKLILRALQNRPKTFTELLHITHLPRKTLSLRLKALVKSGRIVKKGGYHLNGSIKSKEWNGKLKTPIFLGKKHVLLLLLILAISMPSAAHVYAIFTRPTGPVIREVFTAEIVVNNIVDLYAWQAAVTFDPNVLVVLNVTQGKFFNVEFPFLVWSDDSFLGDGNLLLGATLHGDVSGVSGSGTLAYIEFGIIGEGTQELKLIEEAYSERVPLLYDSTGKEISDVSITLQT